MLIISLYKAAGIRPSGELLAAALCHDLSELATGDIPTPVKREHPALKAELHRVTEAWETQHGLCFNLLPEETELLLWCDRIEFALFSLEEVTMGNRFFEVYLTRILDWLNGMPIPFIHGSAEYTSKLLVGVHEAANYELNLGKPT